MHFIFILLTLQILFSCSHNASQASGNSSEVGNPKGIVSLDNEPIADAKLYLINRETWFENVTQGKPLILDSTQSDQNGEFYFPLPDTSIYSRFQIWALKDSHYATLPIEKADFPNLQNLQLAPADFREVHIENNASHEVQFAYIQNSPFRYKVEENSFSLLQFGEEKLHLLANYNDTIWTQFRNLWEADSVQVLFHKVLIDDFDQISPEHYLADFCKRARWLDFTVNDANLVPHFKNEEQL
jgi:hypothetical protein